MIEEQLPAALDGERLDRVVSLVTAVSRADAAVLIANGGVEVDGEPATVGKVRLREGQVVRIDPTRLPEPELPGPQPEVDVVVRYADDDVIVVAKSPGLVVHPGAGNPDGTLVNGLLARYPEIASVGESHRPGIVHRLDVGTSGLLVVARTPLAYDVLVGALSSRDVGRTYRTLVWGYPANPHGVIDAPIGRDHRDAQRMAVVVDGKSARTHYRVLRRYDQVVDVAELECKLETGRTHQIRVHLAAVGHPVVGDGTYGGGRPGVEIPRPFLHAASLSFDHPSTGERLTFDEPMPADLTAVIDALGNPIADED